jgi:hypothetical protein
MIFRNLIRYCFLALTLVPSSPSHRKKSHSRKHTHNSPLTAHQTTTNCLYKKSVLAEPGRIIYSFMVDQAWGDFSALGFLPVFGVKMASILFPSSFGMLSSCPKSFRRSANFRRSNSPLSLNWIARPLNCT